MQTAHKFKRKETRTLAADYLLFLPAGYNPRSSQNPKLYEWFLQHQRRPASARK